MVNFEDLYIIRHGFWDLQIFLLWKDVWKYEFIRRRNQNAFQSQQDT